MLRREDGSWSTSFVILPADLANFHVLGGDGSGGRDRPLPNVQQSSQQTSPPVSVSPLSLLPSQTGLMILRPQLQITFTALVRRDPLSEELCDDGDPTSC